MPGMRAVAAAPPRQAGKGRGGALRNRARAQPGPLGRRTSRPVRDRLTHHRQTGDRLFTAAVSPCAASGSGSRGVGQRLSRPHGDARTTRSSDAVRPAAKTVPGAGGVRSRRFLGSSVLGSLPERDTVPGASP